jgi:hypothetical protein
MEMDEVCVQLYTPPSIDQLYSFLQLITIICNYINNWLHVARWWGVCNLKLF